MWRFIGFLIILMVSVWLGTQIAKDPGLAFFSYRQWSVEMPLWFAATGLMVLLFGLYFLLRLFDGIENIFYRWKNWLFWRRKHKSYSKTNRGLIELLEGHWKEAENYLLDGMEQSDAKLINYLALAKAAHEQGLFDRREEYLRKAYLFGPKADVAIGLTQAQLQLNQGQLEQALATLTHLRAIAPKHKFVLRLLERLYVRLGDWKNLIILLPQLTKAGGIPREEAVLRELQAYTGLLKMVKVSPDDVSTLEEVWKSLPRRVQKDPQIIFCYATQLLSCPGSEDEVERVINRALKKSFDNDLSKLYGTFITSDPKKQLAHAENLLKHYPNQASLLFTLGRLCVRCQLWGKARSYFEDSLNIEANTSVYAEYGKLLEQLEDPAAAMDCYRDGLILCADVDPGASM